VALNVGMRNIARSLREVGFTIGAQHAGNDWLLGVIPSC